ncbi:hypothetical protein MF621_004123 (plasmid) [Bacillus velezensis]|uniref:hypothetical protein n=1 Tax=Bacillus velezensis TaxID=492670 RepID=UPI00049EA96A|nr:hypothetical protein [Bacillus velezensis]KDN91335.1 hypothetical protein EF87_19335 [Bacillus amyloliquefaciens]URJ76416.1 hypothetical protein MF619_003989 [Bacillus velezensis]URJ80372.1 hypothetical protein MF621_004123 [Bacillus velezensis]
MGRVNLQEWLAQEKVQESIKEKINQVESYDIQVYHEDFSSAEVTSATANKIESNDPTILNSENDGNDTEIEFSVDIEYELEISAEELDADSSPYDSETKDYAWENYETNTYTSTLTLPTTVHATITDNEDYKITYVQVNSGESITGYKKPSDL